MAQSALTGESLLIEAIVNKDKLKEPADPPCSEVTALKEIFPGDSEMAQRMRDLDWTKTSLGPVDRWPQSLRTSVSTCLDCAFPILIWWGPQLTMLYNDEYKTILGPVKHPAALGESGAKVWPEIWDVIHPMLSQVMTEGQATRSRDLLLNIDRGFVEEAYFSFSYSPIRAEGGTIGGIFCPVIETTQKVVGERRLQTLRDLAAECQAASTEQAEYEIAARVLAQNSHDVPFALVYRIDLDQSVAVLEATAGIDRGMPSAPERVSIAEGVASIWQLSTVAYSGTRSIIAEPTLPADLPSGAWSVPVKSVLILPVLLPGQDRPRAILVAAASPMRELDTDYRTFFELIATQIAAGLADSQALETERRNVAKLAEINRAKTNFFSNVSHEFRTPLTLMLGPIEDAVANPVTPAPVRLQLELAHRNSLRLLKLVNSLLDFSRIEAGRMEPSYEPADLATLTRDLASNFRSAIERAGLTLIVECEDLGESIYVDREMWEKIVLNLLSNAFKYTLEGAITVRLRREDKRALLEVVDTGVGISTHELPRIFERFHRVEGVAGRTQEGSGIGLSLVQELVRLQGGIIHVASEPGRGTTFQVRLPLGSEHLSSERIRTTRSLGSTAVGAGPYVQEALRWLPDRVDRTVLGFPALRESPTTVVPDRRFAHTAGARIVLADDNADLRAYVSGLLAGSYRVEAVADGQQALEAVRREPPDLILSDIMMPRLDGFGLIRALRADERLRAIPIILLSARAGEESRIDGLDTGADDYLVKPFSARELLARVGALIELTRMRQENEERFRTFVSATSDVIYRMSPDWSEMRHLVGRNFILDTTDPNGSWLDTYIHPDDQPHVMAAIHEAIRTKTVFQLEHRVRRMDGTLGWTFSRAIPLKNDAGEILEWFGAAADVTERKGAEEALRERDEQLRLATEAAEVGLWDVDTVSDTLFWPPRVKAMFGISPHVPVSMVDFYAGLHPEDREQTAEAFAAALDPDRRALYDVEYRAIGRDDGLIRWIAAKGRGIFNDKGRCVRVIGTAIDITERKRSAEALSASQRRSDESESILAAALSSTTDAVFIGDADGRLIHSNKAFASYHRFKSEEECSKHISDCPKLIQAFLSDGCEAPVEMWALPRALRGETGTNIEYSLRRRDSGETWVGSYSFGPIRRADGAIGGAVVVARDISVAKRAEEVLRVRERLLRLASAAARIGAFDWTVETDQNTWSVELESMYGLRPGAFGGTRAHWEELLHPEDRPGAVAKLEEALESGEPVEHEWRAVWPDGSVHWLFARFQAVKDQSGKALRLNGVNLEITGRKEMEMALLAADRHKDEFLAMLAHELRNPLAAISVASELLARTVRDDASSQTVAGMMKRQVKQLTRLVDDLLDVSRITQGRIQLQNGVVDLAAVITQALETVEPQLREKRHELSATALSYQPLYVMGDLARLVQCVGNILTNAIKYTAPGGRISIRTGADESSVSIEVSDTGTGIPEELLPRVFDLFVQSERTLDRSQGGLGIGLAVVKRLAQMHGGDVFGRSAGLGQGSTFEIRLPRLTKPVAETAEPAATCKMEPRRVLIVDDNVDAANALSMLLSAQGHEAQVAYSAQEALARSEEFKPDIGILDIGLPEISGYELAKQLRAKPQFKELRLVALTGYGQAEDRQRALSAGFDDHLVKPVEMAALERTLAGLSGEKV